MISLSISFFSLSVISGIFNPRISNILFSSIFIMFELFLPNFSSAANLFVSLTSWKNADNAKCVLKSSFNAVSNSEPILLTISSISSPVSLLA